VSAAGRPSCLLDGGFELKRQHQTNIIYKIHKHATESTATTLLGEVTVQEDAIRDAIIDSSVCEQALSQATTESFLPQEEHSVLTISSPHNLLQKVIKSWFRMCPFGMSGYRVTKSGKCTMHQWYIGHTN